MKFSIRSLSRHTSSNSSRRTPYDCRPMILHLEIRNLQLGGILALVAIKVLVDCQSKCPRMLSSSISVRRVSYTVLIEGQAAIGGFIHMANNTTMLITDGPMV